MTRSSAAKAIYHRTDNGIARLTLCRPQKKNAFDDEMIAQINHQLSVWRQDGSIRALVIDAEGDCFCAGADLAWMKRMAEMDYQENLKDSAELSRMMQQIDLFPCPVITLVQGPAYGGALGIVAASDVVFASPEAMFCLSEVKIGLIPAVISPYVTRAIGDRQMRRYALTAELIDAAKALQLGLIHEIMPVDDLAIASEQLVQRIRNNSPAAVCAAKELLRDVYVMPVTDELVLSTQQKIAAIRVSKEGQEGLAAFLEKRRPCWSSET